MNSSYSELDECNNECDENATCEKGEDGVYGCQCNEGFSGDGTECSSKYISVLIPESYVVLIMLTL